jgi:hypothetical protein
MSIDQKYCNQMLAESKPLNERNEDNPRKAMIISSRRISIFDCLINNLIKSQNIVRFNLIKKNSIYLMVNIATVRLHLNFVHIGTFFFFRFEAKNVCIDFSFTIHHRHLTQTFRSSRTNKKMVETLSQILPIFLLVAIFSFKFGMKIFFSKKNR